MPITVLSDVIMPNSVISSGVRGKNLRPKFTRDHAEHGPSVKTKFRVLNYLRRIFANLNGDHLLGFLGSGFLGCALDGCGSGAGAGSSMVTSMASCSRSCRLSGETQNSTSAVAACNNAARSAATGDMWSERS